MKTSTRYLAESVRDDLRKLVDYFTRHIMGIQMILLYDRRLAETIFGKEPPQDGEAPEAFGLVIVTQRRMVRKRWYDVFRVYDRFLEVNGRPVSTARPVFFNVPLFQLNRELKAGFLFCSALKEKGVLLYDVTRRRLARRSSFDFPKIGEQVRAYYDKNIPVAEEFLWCAEFCLAERKTRAAMFLLHQVAENYLHILFFVHTQYWIKHHDILVWIDYCRLTVPGFAAFLQRDMSESIRLYEVLQATYIGARYDSDYSVSDEDAAALLRRVRALRSLTVRFCRERFACYGRMISYTRGCPRLR